MADPLLDLDSSSVHLLLSVAELGSISKAASRHGLSQPSASRRVRDLERRIGVELVNRSTGGAALSSAGLHLAEELRDVVNATESLFDAANTYRSKDQLAVVLAATRPTVRHDLNEIAAQLRSALPETEDTSLQMSVQLMSTLEVSNAVREGLVDFGLVDGPKAPIGVTSIIIKTVTLQVVVSPLHLWARQRRTISCASLLSTSLLLPKRRTGTRDAIEEALRLSGGQRLSAPAIEAGTDQRIALATLGPHPTIVRPEAAAEAISLGHLVAVPVDVALEQPIRLIWKGAKPSDIACARFVEIASQAMKPTTI